MKKETNNSPKCPICRRLTHKESKYCIFHASAEEKTEEEFKKALKKYIQEIKKENKDYDFKEFIFIGDIYFKKDLNITVFKSANFREATFKGVADFRGATFKEYAFFEMTTFEGVTYFWKAIFKGYANFREATFKGYAFFMEVTFKKNTFFKRATFEEYAYFMKATFKGYAYFQGAIFEKDVSFGETTQEEATDFGVAIYKETLGFWKRVFREIVKNGKKAPKDVTGFKRATYVKDADFRMSTQEEDADLRIATIKMGSALIKVTLEEIVHTGEKSFQGVIGFKGATFVKDANFQEVTFKGNVYLLNASFEENADFRSVIFEGDVDFRLKHLINILYFSKIKVLSGKKLFVRLDNGRGNISLERAYLENIYLNLELNKEVLINFSDAFLKDTNIQRDQIEDHILQEKKKEFSRAQKIYLHLKNNFHSIGQYDDESWAYIKERDMERMSQSLYPFLNKYKKYSSFEKILMKSNVLKRVIIKTKIFNKWLLSKKAIKWFNLSVSNFIYQYGENPWRVIRFAFIMIFSFAVILNVFGIVNSDNTNSIIKFLKENKSNEYSLKYLGANLGSFLNCLYFSTVTFTTLGYGDFQPAVGASRFFVSLEAIIGAITMALFVYTFARRTGGR